MRQYLVFDGWGIGVRGDITIIVAAGCTITGTAGVVEIIGTDGDDVICGAGGDDTLGWWLLVQASALWDPQRRGWHDKAAGTIVVKAPRPSRPASSHDLLTEWQRRRERGWNNP